MAVFLTKIVRPRFNLKTGGKFAEAKSVNRGRSTFRDEKSLGSLFLINQ